MSERTKTLQPTDEPHPAPMSVPAHSMHPAAKAADGFSRQQLDWASRSGAAQARYTCLHQRPACAR